VTCPLLGFLKLQSLALQFNLGLALDGLLLAGLGLGLPSFGLLPLLPP
jgi:hypothetical protein